MKEVYLYRKLKNGAVQCQTCAHYCNILPGKRGICGVRENQGGKLYALNYGKVIALSIDPIEKKPFFHFLPKTHSLSLSTVGCNFKCQNCQNWEISQFSGKEIPGRELSPKEIVKTAKENNLPSISYTYTEPAIFSEYALDIMKLARKEGIKNAWVSNGFWSEELFNEVFSYLDAVNCDLKSFSEDFYANYCSAKLRPVLDTLRRLKKKKIWTEITTLIIPTLNDSEETFESIASFIKQELGPQTPWHISRFFGNVSWKLRDLPDTPLRTLEQAYKTGKEAGLTNVYMGNV